MARINTGINLVKDEIEKVNKLLKEYIAKRDSLQAEYLKIKDDAAELVSLKAELQADLAKLQA